jgi:putative ABC transport system permease protein
MEQLWRDVRYAVRSLINNPGFAAVAIVTIALGVGANTAIFSVVRAVLLRPLPYDDPDRLVMVWGELQARNMPYWPHSPPDFRDYREQTELFEDVAGVFTFRQPLTGEGDPVQITVGGVTESFFRLLGVSPSMGRDFIPDDVIPPDPDAQAGSQPPGIVILSHGFWQRKFGGAPDAVGRSVELGGQPAEIVGILPPDFRLHMPPGAQMPENVDLWTAARIDFDTGNRNNVFLRVVGRLRPGASIEQGQAEMSALATRFREQDQIKEASGFQLHVVPLHEDLTSQVRPVMWALMGAVAFVLLIACANVSNLLLVRASAREREVAVRAALGAGRRRIIGQMLIESVVLAAVGGVGGLLLANVGIDSLLALQPGDLPRIETVSVDGAVLGFTVGATLLAALIFGLLPAVQASRLRLTESLKERSRSATSNVQRLLRNGVVIAEVALSLVLLIGAGLMVRSFVELQRVDPGYDAQGVLTFGLQLPGARYPDPTDRDLFQRQLQERLSGLPGVVGVSGAFPIPLDEQAFAGRYGPEEALEDETRYGQADYRVVLPGFFEVLGTRLIEGRTFTQADNADSATVVVVDEKLAQALFPGQAAVGRRILIRATTPDPQLVEIVGVVEHQRHPSVARDGRETVFFTDRYVGSFGAMTWAVRASVEPTSLVGQVRREVAALDELIPLDNVRPMQAYVDESMASTRFSLVLIGIFGLIALVLAAVGLYGVLAYTVRQRTGEIGIRMAFGAERRAILRLVVRQGMALAGAGIGLGLVAALALTRVMDSMLVGITATDPSTFGGIAIIFALVAVAACLLPALRATRVDPVEALRAD